MPGTGLADKPMQLTPAPVTPLAEGKQLAAPASGRLRPPLSSRAFGCGTLA